MTTDQAADILGCTENTVRGYIREGLLTARVVTWRVGPRGATVTRRAYDVRGQDVQGMHRMRLKLGVRAGTAAWRAKRRGGR